MYRDLKGVWIVLGSIIALTGALAWPAWARSSNVSRVSSLYGMERDRTTLPVIPASIRGTRFESNLTVTSGYTSYLPVILGGSLTDPLNTLISLINTERQRNGLPPLKVNHILMRIAQAHSESMRDQNFFSHTDLNGVDPCTRMTDAGYVWQACGENIGAGYPTAQAVFQGWMNSPGHRNNLLSPDFTEIGVGYTVGGSYHYYWTVDLARPQ
ncbi:MAG: CAP domain-containing protein [Anaerolineae bacterium]